MTMTANISWAGGVSFRTQADTGHTIMMDDPAEKGGQSPGARPIELMSMGMGGCTSFDIMNIMQKSR